MAVVYEATHRNRARFAVKVLHATLSHNTEARSRFLREGYAANSVGHPGAVLVVDEDVAEDGSAFLVMELLDGMGCEELWKKMERRLAPELASAILLQVLDVLVAAHESGIVHRDIKPANLFAMRSGAVKILDFGIARAREAMLSATATSSGVTLGTPAFMSPEQASGKARELDGRTDVWSAAATYFTLVSGEFVHASAESALLLLVAASTSPPRSIATVDSRVPPAIVAVVDRALSLRPEDRWPTAESMRDALAEAHHSSFGSASPEEVVGAAVRALVGTRVSAAAFAPVHPTVITGSPTSRDRTHRREARRCDSELGVLREPARAQEEAVGAPGGRGGDPGRGGARGGDVGREGRPGKRSRPVADRQPGGGAAAVRRDASTACIRGGHSRYDDVDASGRAPSAYRVAGAACRRPFRAGDLGEDRVRSELVHRRRGH